MGALIDSIILVAVDRGTLDLDDLLQTFPDERWFMSTVAASELLHGVWRTNSPVQRAARLAFAEDTILRFPVLAFDLAAARTHADIWATLARRGAIVGERDLMIAATARSRDFAVATRDLKSFPKIPGLRVLQL